MAKMRVYELAKELGLESKDVIELLEKNNIVVRSQSGLDEEMCDLVYKYIDDDPELSKKVAVHKEPPKKKKKTVVFDLGGYGKRGEKSPRFDGRRSSLTGTRPKSEHIRGPIKVRDGVDAPSVVRARKEAEEARGCIQERDLNKKSFVLKEVSTEELDQNETKFNVRIEPSKNVSSDGIDVDLIIDVKKGSGFKDDKAIIAEINKNSEVIMELIQLCVKNNKVFETT